MLHTLYRAQIYKNSLYKRFRITNMSKKLILSIKLFALSLQSGSVEFEESIWLYILNLQQAYCAVGVGIVQVYCVISNQSAKCIYYLYVLH